MADVIKTIEELADHTSRWDWENKHVAQAYISNSGIEENGTVSINDIIESGTVLLAAFQSFWMAVGIERMGEGAFVDSAGWSFRIMAMITAASGPCPETSAMTMPQEPSGWGKKS
jgi:hypothetical protein